MEKIDNKRIIEPLKKEEVRDILRKIDEEMKKKNIKFTREEAVKDDLYD